MEGSTSGNCILEKEEGVGRNKIIETQEEEKQTVGNKTILIPQKKYWTEGEFPSSGKKKKKQGSRN